MAERERLRLSNVLIRVHDLRTAVADYAALGFTCTWGASAERAHNAFVYFPDGRFIELFVPRRSLDAVGISAAESLGSAAVARIRRLAEQGEGLVDYALQCTDHDIEACVAGIRGGGMRMSDPMTFRRKRPDGRVLAWQMSFPSDLSLPTVMGAYDPPDMHAPQALAHANGARGLRRLELVHPDPPRQAARLARLLGCEATQEGVVIREGRTEAIGAVVLAGLEAGIPAAPRPRHPGAGLN